MTNFHRASQWRGLGLYIWPLMPMLMPLIIDVVHWSVTCVTDGKRVKAILKELTCSGLSYLCRLRPDSW